MSGAPPNADAIVERAACRAADWDAVAAASNDAWLWHQHDYIAALATWPDRRDCSFALTADRSIAAIVPLHIVTLRVRGVAVGRLADSVGGPAVASGVPPHERERWYARAIDAMRLRAKAAKALWLDVRLPTLSPLTVPGATPPALVDYGLDDRSGQAYVVDLAEGGDRRWTQLEKRVRTSVRKAEKLGVTVRETTDAADVGAYYALHLETYRRTRATPHPRAYFEAIWRLASRGLAMILVAELDGRVVAAATFGVDKQTSLYWTAANSARGLDVSASPLLQWTATTRLASRGIRWHEMGEAFPGEAAGKSRGLDLFKRGFGGRLHPVRRGRLVLRPRVYRAMQAARRLRARSLA